MNKEYYMKKKHKQSQQFGFGLLEIIVAISLIAISLFSLGIAGRIAHRAADEASREAQAYVLLEEGFEATRIIRDQSWSSVSSLNVSTTYYLFFESNMWQTTTAPQQIDGIFTRSFVLQNIYRDASDAIAPSGILDPDARKLEMTVSWQEPGETRSIEGKSYLMNIFLE